MGVIQVYLVLSSVPPGQCLSTHRICQWCPDAWALKLRVVGLEGLYWRYMGFAIEDVFGVCGDLWGLGSLFQLSPKLITSLHPKLTLCS